MILIYCTIIRRMSKIPGGGEGAGAGGEAFVYVELWSQKPLLKRGKRILLNSHRLFPSFNYYYSPSFSKKKKKKKKKTVSLLSFSSLHRFFFSFNLAKQFDNIISVTESSYSVKQTRGRKKNPFPSSPPKKSHHSTQSNQ